MTMDTALPKKRGGRPPIRRDNRRVQTFMCKFMKTSQLLDNFPSIDDVFSGVVWLQTVGEKHDGPLSKRNLFRVLRSCEVIETTAVTAALAVGHNAAYSKSTVARYSAAARVASRAIARLLETHPDWEDYEEEFEEDFGLLAA